MAGHDQQSVTGTPDYTLDNRGLEPPEPMVRVLNRIAEMKSGGILAIHNDRIPRFLLPRLDALGCQYEYTEQEDGSVRMKIDVPASAN